MPSITISGGLDKAMGFWEFLIQKEGDRSWLPLESPDVEILEGRYRVVARSNRVNTPVEIQVIHIAIAENPPKRRTQKRSGQTNLDGLVVVIPFTRLQPGIWELSCAGDLMADFAGEGWQYTVKLQVLSHASEATEEWETDWQTDSSEADSVVTATTQTSQIAISPASVDEPSEPSPIPPSAALPAEPEPELERLTVVPPMPSLELDTEEPNAPRAKISEAIAASDIFQMAARLSQEIVDSVFQDLETASAEPSVASSNATPEDSPIQPNTSPDFEVAAVSTASTPETTSVAADAVAFGAPESAADCLSVELTLNQDTYTARRGQMLTLAGQIKRSPADPTSIAIPAVELRIRLHDPQNAQVLVDVTRSLPIQTVPSPFECSITIPDGYQTRLLLGSLALLAGTTELANHSFSVTADLTELLEAIANAHPESDLVQPPLEFTTPTTAADLDLTFLEFLQSPKPMLQFQPADQQAMPPQLHPAKPPQATKQTPTTLPMTVSVAGTAVNQTSVTNRAASAPPTSTSDAVQSSANNQPNTSINISSSSPTLSDLVLDDNISPHNWHPPTPPPQPRSAPVKRPLSSEDEAFQSLNLQHRFFSRLNALANDSELSSWLNQDSQNTIEALPVNEAPLGLDTDLAAHEVVVEDEPPFPPHSRQMTPIKPPAELVLPDDEPVPEPELNIPPGELVSGQSIFVTVKLPNVQSKVYVKMWVLDRQTRSLLDGPRWFMAFVPDGLGYLETRTQVTVPHGCLEASFEAIAIEMITKRESHKVAVNCKIIPPDLPALGETDLEI